MAQEPQQNEPIAGDRFLKTLGIDPNKWTVGDRRIALLGIGIGLTIVIIAVCGYVFGWEWTGLTKPQRTFWDWLSLLIVPIVLALGGYLFNRSESRRTKDDADRQRALDRELADARRQDDMLQAYLDGMSQLLTDEKRPLHRAQVGDSLSTVARARTLTVLTRLDGERKGSVVRFVYESGLIIMGRPVLALEGADLNYADLRGADLRGAGLRGTNLIEADLFGADLQGATLHRTILIGADLRAAKLRRADLRETDLNAIDLRGADLFKANLEGASGITNEGLEAQALLDASGITKEQVQALLEPAESLEGATMPNGQKYEDWLKSRQGDGENRGSS